MGLLRLGRGHVRARLLLPSPSSAAPAAPTLLRFPQPCGRRGPCSPDKSELFQLQLGMAHAGGGPAVSACSVCTDLGGLPLFGPLEEWQRPVGEWECQGGTEKAAHLYLRLAGIWRGPRGSWILPLDLVLTKAHRSPGFLFLYLHPFIFSPFPLFVFH